MVGTGSCGRLDGVGYDEGLCLLVYTLETTGSGEGRANVEAVFATEVP